MTKEDIHKICNKHNITNYTINDDLSIDVNGSVYLKHSTLKELPLRFRNVTGFFYCVYENITSLEGAPISVGGPFFCYYNNLESLKGIPLNLSEKQLSLPDHFTYSDYLAYCRNLKFKKLLKCL